MRSTHREPESSEMLLFHGFSVLLELLGYTSPHWFACMFAQTDGDTHSSRWSLETLIEEWG